MGEDAYKRYKRDDYLKNTHGISIEEYEEMLEDQDGKCYVCGGVGYSNGRLDVDHCHKTGRVRRLLCPMCNRALGMMRECSESILSLALYAEEHKVD